VKLPLVAAISLAILSLAAKPAPAQVLSTIIAAPVEGVGLSARLVGEGIAIDGSGIGRLDLWFPSGGPGPFALTYARLSTGPLLLGGGLLQVPAFKLMLPIPSFTISALHERLRLSDGPWSASLAMADIFVPRIDSGISISPISLESRPVVAFAGSLGYRDLSVGLSRAEIRGWFNNGQMTDYGDLSGSVVLATLRCGEWGALYGSASGRARIAIKSWLTSVFDLPWGTGDASMDLRFAAAWGSVRVGGPRLGGSIGAAAGLVWNLEVSAKAASGHGGLVTGESEWSLRERRAGIALAYPSIYWRPSRSLYLSAGRWLPFFWGWSTARDSGIPIPSIAAPAPTSTSSASGSSLATILFSGLEFRGKYSMR
jgi:hypothetical protein